MVNAADSKQRPKSLTGKRIRSELPTNVIFLSILGYSVHGDILMFTVWYILGRQSPSPASDIQLLSRSTFQYSVAFEEAKVQNQNKYKSNKSNKLKKETPNRIN
jgi:hypothetical protein